jgi:hypothetical protein
MKGFSLEGRVSPRQAWYLTLFYVLVVSLAVWLGCFWYFAELQKRDMLLVQELFIELTQYDATR